MTTIDRRIAQVLAAAFGIAVDRVTPTTSQDDLEDWDSLSQIQLIAALEAEFSVAFSIDQAIAMTSVQAIRDALVEHGIA